METIINQYITLAACYGIMAIGYLAWLSSGVINTKYIKKREWSWSIFWEDLLKLLSHIGSIACFVLGVNLLNWMLIRCGVSLALEDAGVSTNTLADLFSVGGVVLMTLKSSANYYARAYQNYQTFHSKRWTEEIPLEIDPNKIDWQGVAKDVRNFCKEVADAITPEHTANAEQTEANAEPSEEELAILREIQEFGLGAEVNPLARTLPDGDNDGGKGWQCSKYAWFLATGERMNHKPHPDYGPCHGKAMVDFLIQKLGWVECKKQDGAIFSYNAGQYGHTGIVKNAAQNLVNDANWTPLKIGTHYINLDAVGARYCCPKSQVVQVGVSGNKTPQNENTAGSEGKTEVSTSQPAPKPSAPSISQDKPLIFHKGETVVPLRKVDYDGRKLRQYDETYYIVQDVEEGQDRVVLGARGQIWAAMRVEDVRKI